MAFVRAGARNHRSINIDHGIGAKSRSGGFENVTRGSVARIAGRGRVDEERMKLTIISNPDYFHKVVIASGLVRRIRRFPIHPVDAEAATATPYMINWHVQRVPRDSRAHLRPAVRARLPARARRG